MRLLLDTHALLWFLSGDSRFGPHAIEVLNDEENDIFVSTVSIWEITVKRRIGKLEADIARIISVLPESGLRLLDIAPVHLLELDRLPVQADHRDPFDHLLIAQAISERLVFLSDDARVPRYPVQRMLCRD